MAPTNQTIMLDLEPPLRRGSVEELLVVLVHELIQAHADTLSLAAGFTGDPRWQAHLSYLRGLLVVSRAILAETSGVELL